MEIKHSDYVKSPYWKKFSKKLLDAPDVKCEICQRPKWAIYKVNTKKHKKGDKRRLIVLNLHHKSYVDLGLGKDDVIPLCRRCHLLAHDLERAGNTEPQWKEVYNLLLSLTNWAFTPTLLYEVPDDFVLSKPRKKKK